MTPAPPSDALDTISGQTEVVMQLRAALRRPVHAYLFAGPRGSGKRAAARAFAAELLVGDTNGDAAERTRRLALAEAHPDLEVIEREGASLSREQARDIVDRSVRSPVEGPRKILLLPEFQHAVDAAPILLKAIEEPPPTTMFVILADELVPELVTITSRCLVLHFAPLSQADLVSRLTADGVDTDTATQAAQAAAGDLERAQVLAADPQLGLRVATWRGVPGRLDGHGSSVAAIVDDVTSQLDDMLGPVDARHAAELAALAEQEERYGMTAAASVRKTMDARHRRERRRFRTEELRFGLGVLARVFRDRMGTDGAFATAADLEPFTAIRQTIEALERNPNESLLLHALLVRLAPLR